MSRGRERERGTAPQGKTAWNHYRAAAEPSKALPIIVDSVLKAISSMPSAIAGRRRSTCRCDL
ncbi:hypothetical protein DF3PB_560010 [uncultured Defluviicoccus sp.]|uniref:Uncharacterized protein n=1 Tax=metagenome TaxID=256318 RepID=A0A380TJ43_9ZZZZ|nr:hypothetical protein DF3PB_560010 [uncultured Defluviicoccus sp.]